MHLKSDKVGIWRDIYTKSVFTTRGEACDSQLHELLEVAVAITTDGEYLEKCVVAGEGTAAKSSFCCKRADS